MKSLGTTLLVILLCGASAAVYAQAKGYRETYEGYLWNNSQLLQVRNGKPQPVEKPIKLKNGSVLYPAGYALSAAGEQIKLREGESLDINGNVLYPEYRKDGTIAFLSHQPAGDKINKIIPVPQPPADLKIKKPKK